MRNLNLFFLGSLLTPQIAAQTVTAACQEADQILKQNEELSSDFSEMVTWYEVNKIVATQDDPLVIESNQQYSALTGRNVDRIKSICKDDFGYEICGAVTKTRHFESVSIPFLPIDSIPAVRNIVEVLYPVCVPKTCSLTQTDILYPNPADCDRSTGECLILSNEIICLSSRQEPEDSTSCADDIIPENNPINFRLNALQTTMQASCATTLAGVSSSTCTLDFSDFEIATTTDLSLQRDTLEQFLSFSQTCEVSGGQICNADLTAEYNLQFEGTGNIFLTEDFSQFPFCISSQCFDEKDLESITAETFRWYTEESRIATDCEEDRCQINVKSVSCGGETLFSAATSSPSSTPETLPPTPSPSSTPETLPPTPSLKVQIKTNPPTSFPTEKIKTMSSTPSPTKQTLPPTQSPTEQTGSPSTSLSEKTPPPTPSPTENVQKPSTSPAQEDIIIIDSSGGLKLMPMLVSTVSAVFFSLFVF